jgi:hypothetical protein
MSRFYAEIQGNRGRASRQGTPASGMWAHVRGWDVGVQVQCNVGHDGQDSVWIYLTRGSNGGIGSNKLIGLVHVGDDELDLWIDTGGDRVKLSDLIEAWANK